MYYFFSILRPTETLQISVLGFHFALLLFHLSNFFCTERDFFRALRNYGRNCFGRSEPTVFDDSKSWFHHAHYGNPIDEIDRACFHVGRAYKCMFLDHESGNLQDGLKIKDGSWT